MIKLVLSDLDSTLLWKGERHIATPHALEAIHALQDAGVCFAPATGRLYPELEGMFAGDRDAFRSAVVSNGQLVYLDGELAQSTPTPREGLEELRMLLSDVDDVYLVVVLDGERIGVDVDLDYVLAHPDNFWHVRSTVDSVPSTPCFKANVRVVGTWERALEVANWLNSELPGLEFTCPMPGFGHIDVVPAGVGKEKGGDVLVERLGIDPSEVCCFGDAENDLSVLTHYPNSVAVANAMPSVAAASRWHIGPANEDSVADAFFDIARATSEGRMPDFMHD